MGKTRTKLIDDSVAEEKKVSQPKPKKPEKKQADSLVAKLQEELGITPEKPRADTSEVEAEVTQEDTSEVEKKEKQTQPSERSKVSKKVQKPGKAKLRGKKYQEVTKDLDRARAYPLTEAIDIVKKLSYSKFDGTLEVHINTSQTGIRGLASLPFTSGKKLTILAFGPSTGSGQAKDSGADIVGSDATLEDIEKGKITFDILITTPEWMPKLAKVAKYLGPRGLMPNPKNGTITDDLKKAVLGFQSGKFEYKTEPKAPIIHLGLGKLNQPNAELEANIKTLLQALGKSRVKKVTLSPTMGPGVKLDLSSI